MNDIPDVFLENVAWSFSEPISQSPSELVDDVTKYNDEFYVDPFKKEILTALSPFIRLDISYAYYIERPNGEWDDIPMKVRIDGDGKRLSYADILWQLHKAVYPYLKEQDNHFFEGLEIIKYEDEEGIPLYKIWLGS